LLVRGEVSSSVSPRLFSAADPSHSMLRCFLSGKTLPFLREDPRPDIAFCVGSPLENGLLR
jgi:hypothetical protein